MLKKAVLCSVVEIYGHSFGFEFVCILYLKVLPLHDLVVVWLLNVRFLKSSYLFLHKSQSRFVALYNCVGMF